jgi:hypothetical protein
MNNKVKESNAPHFTVILNVVFNRAAIKDEVKNPLNSGRKLLSAKYQGILHFVQNDK